MRTNLPQRILLFITILLTLTFWSCSIRKTDKEKGHEKIHSEISEQTNLSVDQEQSKIENSFIERKDYSNWFNFEYKPLFDQNGQIIPLIIKQTKNGQTEKIVISGATVTGGQNESKQSEEKRTQTINRYISNITYKSEITYKSVINKKIVLKERFSYGPQSIYIICLLGITIVCAVLAFTGHWNWIQNVFNKIKKYFSKSNK
ncbi:hypothetical protein [Empedobacter falsenii]|uniref:hypothetical protein n=1 Tax=Empedobacter falsenii TaxID=343874 RepID=UPI000F66F15D|nr:hypothetical protein [Empedobacter falsenii]